MPEATAFESFYREHHARIVQACALVLLDRSAEDVAAEAFARLWSRWGAIGSEDRAGGFVFKTAMRLCWKEAARRGRRIPESAQAPDDVARALDRHDVGDALRTLPVRQRQAVVLRDWAGFGTDEVARMLGMRESTVRVHLARAREQPTPPDTAFPLSLGRFQRLGGSPTHYVFHVLLGGDDRYAVNVWIGADASAADRALAALVVGSIEPSKA
jgi:RNA polymerase sigma factor (sigma-70 family)